MSGYFAISDGTTKINLASDTPGGFHISEWIPLAPPPENLWQASPFSDGRQLAQKRFGNTADYLKFHAEGDCQDITIQLVQDLRRLLMKAVEYWTSEWTTEPVWIETRGEGETNTRYAYIYDFDMPHDDNPFSPPFGIQPAVMEDLELTLEHSWWLNNLAGTCVKIGQEQSFERVMDIGPFQPGLSEDDAYVDVLATTITTGTAFLAFGNNVTQLHTGVRFNNVGIPPGAIVTKAFIRFTAEANDATDTVNTDIYGEDVDDAPTFSTYADFMARTRTTAKVDWDAVPHFVAGSTYDTPDLSAIIQEIIDRPGWSAANSVVLFVQDNASDLNAYRQPSSWDSALDEPMLYIDYVLDDTLAYGQEPTCANHVYVANKHNRANFTHIYFYDADIAAFSANLVAAATPFDFLPAVPAVGDYVCFIISSLVPNGGPFNNIVFDIGATMAGVTGAVWEYYNGAWVTLPVRDNTNQSGAMTGIAFDTIEPNIVAFTQKSDWIPSVVNGVTGYAVRLRITAAAGATPPAQQAHKIYSAVWPYVQIDPVPYAGQEQVGGDVELLARIKAYCESYVVIAGSENLPPDKIMIALRSLSRGYDFTPYINLADEQNPTGITISVNAGFSAFATNTTAAAGRIINALPVVANTWENMASIQLTATISEQYIGKYRLYLRCKQSSGAFGNFQVKYKIWNVSTALALFESAIVAKPMSDDFVVLDLGILTVNRPVSGAWENIGITFYVRCDVTVVDLYLYDIMLMPIDEWSAEYTGNFGWITYIDIDPVTQPKYHNPANIKFVDTDNNYFSATCRGISPPMLQANSSQRLWFFSNNDAIAPSVSIHIVNKILLTAVSKYFTFRGAR